MQNLQFTDKYTTRDIIHVSSKQNHALFFRDSLHVFTNKHPERLRCLFLEVNRNKIITEILG